jgi:hypothetical protein
VPVTIRLQTIVTAGIGGGCKARISVVLQRIHDVMRCMILWSSSRDQALHPAKPHNRGVRHGLRSLAALLAVLIAVVACADGSSPRRIITGTLTLLDNIDNMGLDSTGGCGGDGGYRDINSGLGVVLKDGEAKTIAVGALGPGKLSRASGGFSSTATSYCAFSFSLDNVPEVPFYSIEVGHRGAITYSLAQMTAANWTVSLTLGQ